jgi:hypothetical protein
MAIPLGRKVSGIRIRIDARIIFGAISLGDIIR